MFANIHYSYNKNLISLWEYNSDGQRNLIEEKYISYCYVGDPNGNFKDLYGKTCRRKEFADYMAQREFVKNYETFEGDIAPDSRFLIDRYYNTDLLQSPPELDIHILDIEVSHNNGMPKSDVIEDEILLITVYSTKTKTWHTFGTKNYTGSKKVEYHHCEDEKDLLKQYFKYHRSSYPDVLSGWFSSRFDYPYILDRAIILFGEGFLKKYSPVGDIELKNFGDYKEYNIGGIAQLDYIDLYKKYSVNESESYKLNYIAQKELGKGKLAFEGSLNELWKEDWNKFVDYNIEDVELVKEIHERLDFIGLTQSQAYLSKVPLNKVDSAIRKFDNYLLSVLKPLNIVLPTAKRRDEVSIPGGYVSEIQRGFYKYITSYDFTSLYPHLMFALNLSPETFVAVVEPLNEKHKILLDNGIIYTHIDLESILDNEEFKIKDKFIIGSKLKELIINKKLIISANGILFRSDIEGFIPKVVKGIFAQRKEYKDISKKNEKLYEDTKEEKYSILAKRYDLMQSATKVLANAAYGILANPNFRLFDPNLATAITATGQKLIKFVGENTNKLFKDRFGITIDSVVASDTDSIYLNIEPFIRKINAPDNKLVYSVNMFSEKLFDPFIIKLLEDFSKNKLNNEKNWFHLKREAICKGAIFIEKKRYALNVIDNEGTTYKEPKIKVKGIEIVRSSTPSFCRDKIKEVVKRIFDNHTKQQIIEYITEVNKQFKKEDLANIAKPSGVKNIDDYIENGLLKKGCPMHVRAAVNYNKLIKEKNLENYYDIIQNGNKMRFIYLQSIDGSENIIGFVDRLPKEFGLYDKIDYNLQFSKTFMSPIDKITETMGWGQIDLSVNSIDEFF